MEARAWDALNTLPIKQHKQRKGRNTERPNKGERINLEKDTDCQPGGLATKTRRRSVGTDEGRVDLSTKRSKVRSKK